MDEKGAGGALVLRGGKLRPVQRASVKRNGFSQAGRARFIEVLAATCNVKLATDASGVCGSAIYNTRRRDPAFAADWDAALASGAKGGARPRGKRTRPASGRGGRGLRKGERGL